VCDTLCVRTADGMLFAKNSDRHPGEPQVVETFGPHPPGPTLTTQYLSIDDAGAFAFTGSRPTWLWGVEHGVNEYGVAIGNEKIWTVDRPHDGPPALLGMDLVRLGLERARSADDALMIMTALLEQHGQGGSGEPHADEPYFSSFLMVDADTAWIVETSDRTWAARRVDDAGCAISNRISLTDNWTLASKNVASGTSFDTYRLATVPTAIADHRLAVTTNASQHARTIADIAAVLRSHGAHTGPPREVGADWSGFTVCMHRPDLHAQTTASMIATIAKDAPLRVWACLGNPCTGVYVPAFPPAVAPELADAGQWQRFARLRDRVEADPSAQAEIRAVLDPVEADLWAGADEAFATGSRAALSQWAATAYRPVAAALLRLGA
jgi:dipeptidase